MKDAFAWEEPATREGHRSRHAGKWTRVLEPMMEHPKRWARIAIGTDEQMRNLASQLRRGVRETPPGFWSFVTRRIDEEKSATYGALPRTGRVVSGFPSLRVVRCSFGRRAALGWWLGGVLDWLVMR